MAFALGLAVVYMADRLPSSPYVELPSAVSANVFPVFIDKSLLFTRGQNCGLDPADPHARLDCANQRLFGDRDMSIYTRYELTSGIEDECGRNADRETRRLVWKHWNSKTLAHIAVRNCGGECYSTTHYFIEPTAEHSWQVATASARSIWRYVDGESTELTLVGDYGAYNRPHWKTVSRDDAYYCRPRGYRYLEFENITGDTLAF